MGLINEKMGPAEEELPPEQAEAAPPTEAPTEPAAQPAGEDAPEEGAGGGGKLTITPESIESKLHLQGNQAEQLRRIVVAGKKVMFDSKTHRLMIETIKGEGDWPTKLGQGVTGLMGLLMKESQNSLPPPLIIPAGLIMVAEAASFIADTGEDITDQDVGDGMHVFINTILHASGVDGDKLAAYAEKAGAAIPGDAPAPESAPPASEMPPPGGGMINQGMQQ